MRTMQWFTLLGRERALVRAELATISSDKLPEFTGPIGLGYGVPPSWDSLGGVIRAGEIITQAKSQVDLAKAAVAALTIPPESGKITFGISSANLAPRELRSLGKLFKNTYAEKYGKRPRIVFAQTGTILNAGHVQGGKLLTSPNCELFFIRYGTGWLIGKTTWQQDIAAYTRRDRERPARDARVGMLPPKLAQIMLNLAGLTKASHVHDPFCGTGVILTEALIKNAQVSGSDIAPKMVAATLQNLAWVSHLQNSRQTDFEIFTADAQNIQLPATTSHIVSEGYLGNPDLRDHSSNRLQEEATSLMPLYRNFFQNLINFPHPLTIVFALPVWFWANSNDPIHLPILDDLPDMGYTVEQFAPDSATILTYRRPYQTVGRAIIKLRKG